MSCECLQVEGEHSEMDIGLERFVAAPCAAVQAKGAFGCGDDAFDAGAPFAQLFIDAYVLYQFGKRVSFEGGGNGGLEVKQVAVEM